MSLRAKHWFALVLLVALANGSASAATSTLNSSLSFNAQGIGAFSHLITPGFTSFNDLFTFTTTSSSLGATSIASFNGFNFSAAFSSFNLIDVTHGNSVIATGTIGPSFVSQLGFSGLNANTTYGLNIAGILDTPNLGGFYSGSISVSPVPEPTEYVLLACGLLGLIAIRRRSKDSLAAV